jgi:hypothetical protein
MNLGFVIAFAEDETTMLAALQKQFELLAVLEQSQG